MFQREPEGGRERVSERNALHHQTNHPPLLSLSIPYKDIHTILSFLPVERTYSFKFTHSLYVYVSAAQTI